MEIEGQVALVQLSAVVSHQFFVRQVGLAHHHAVIVFIQQRAHAADDVMDLGLVLRVDVLQAEVWVDTIPGRVDRLVAQLCVLDHEPDHIDAEAIDPAFQPEAHLAQQGFQHSRVTIVQLWLLGDELVQVVLSCRFVEGPRRTTEETRPVVGRAAVRRLVAPDVPVASGGGAAAPAFLEPRMFVRGMIGHQIEDQLHAAGVDVGQQCVEVCECAEHGMDRRIVGHVVTEVVHG